MSESNARDLKAENFCHNRNMNTISEEEFERICRGIYEDRETILRHNPIGSTEETLLWMLLGVLINYLSLTELETPCFAGAPTAQTYREAIFYVLRNRMGNAFDADRHLEQFKNSNAESFEF